MTREKAGVEWGALGAFVRSLGGSRTASAGGALLRNVGQLAGIVALFWMIAAHQGCVPGPAPGPAPDPTPTPLPPPKPPTPPAPKPNPISGEGKRVLITYESAEAKGYPIGVTDVLYGVPFREWLEAKVTKDQVRGGMEPCRRIVDKDSDPKHDLKWVQEMLARPRGDPLWIVISNSVTGGFHEGPLPKTEAETRALIERFLP